jgi:hypothetical protein
MSALGISRQYRIIPDEKRIFYEQVTGVKGLFFVFFLYRAFAFVVALGFVALHRVSIRTLYELS